MYDSVQYCLHLRPAILDSLTESHGPICCHLWPLSLYLVSYEFLLLFWLRCAHITPRRTLLMPLVKKPLREEVDFSFVHPPFQFSLLHSSRQPTPSI